MESFNSSQQTQSGTALEEQTSLVPPDSSTDAQPASPSRRHLLPKVLLGTLLFAGAVAAGIFTYQWWQYSQKYQQTDNAYVSANVHPVTSRVSGIVTQVTVNDNQVVSPGTVLVKIDPREYQASLIQAKASLELAKQQAALAQENVKLIADNNYVPLPVPINSNAPSQPQALNRQRDINQQQYKTALAAIAQKEADLKKAQLHLSYTNITALVAGKVAQKNVQVGQQVQAGQTLITVVQPNPWIVANFKETQLEKIQPGQKADIRMIAFPGKTFRGTVDSMSPTSFGKVAPFRGENTTGDTTRSSNEQRIPVKILFEPQSLQGYEAKMTPGLSAVVTIDTKK
ncbi:HlyD family efflux transporter periplasmic adaptor subunit [Scytonema sp. UIC 10036]|uniref:HlyD family secretion protein n=1 Tax=Scytonema sp. UIC 10036 TaxID=2304196 RepID=UPI0012DA58B7|nr:HlyD family secretion protein [Scytonema sp. UIC 10036]MUG95916.1 HlyD family efflux transporter periplasmic adaptor subunit [Scytonema sp. UIC 10036]